MPDIAGVIDEVEVVEDQDRAVDRDRRQFPEERVEDGVPPGAVGPDLGEHRGRRRREGRVVFAPCGNQVVEERHPVAVFVIEPIPQGSQS